MGAAIACAALACGLAFPAAGHAARISLGGPQAKAAAGPMAGDGMWIWYLSRSSGGNLDKIAARARISGIDTVYIKSGDAGKVWTQFNPGIVAALHARGLRVCAWQFIYGTNPLGEANVGVASVNAGADCLVLDVEGQYESKYAGRSLHDRAALADRQNRIRSASLSFPYADHTTGLPTRLFLNASNGAQVDMLQM